MMRLLPSANYFILNLLLYRFLTQFWHCKSNLVACFPIVAHVFVRNLAQLNDLYQYFDLTKLILVTSIVFLSISRMLHVGNIYGECLMVKR